MLWWWIFVLILCSSRSLLKPMRFWVTLRNVRFTILTVKMLLRREWVAAAVATIRLISSVRSLVEIRLLGVWFVSLFIVGRDFLHLIVLWRVLSGVFDCGVWTGGSGRGRRQRRGEDVVHPLKVSLEDLYLGTSKKLSLSRNVLCSKCNGYVLCF